MKNVDNTMSTIPPRADLNQGSPASNRVTGTSAGGRSVATTSTSGASSDTVTFTSTVTEMLKLEESLANIPDIDNARVSAIKVSIEEGRYHINPEKIVDSLLAIEKSFN